MVRPAGIWTPVPLAVAIAVALAVPAGLAWGSGTAGAFGTPAPIGSGPVTAFVAVAPGFSPVPGVEDLGPAPANETLTVDVGLAPRDPAGLGAFVNATQVPGSPTYRSFLSPSVAAARFGASPTAVEAAESYFAQFGLLAVAHPDGLIVSVTGSAPAVGRAFGTTLDRYRAADGSTFLDHPTPASLPTVAPWSGVFGLDTAAAVAPPVSAVATGALARSSDPCGPVGGVSACQVATAYDLAELWANGTDGAGESVAVVDPYTSAENQTDLAADFASFSLDEGLPSATPGFVYPVPGSGDLNGTGVNPDWEYEDPLDLEWAHAAAPGANVSMVFSPNAGSGLYFAIDWIVAEHAADVISMSWGEPEVGVYNAVTTPCSSACNASSDGSFEILDPVLELAAAEGIGAFAASGDCGSADGTSGVAVNYPASDPYVVGVGATNLNVSADGGYLGEYAWSGNASGATGIGCVNQGGSGGGFSILPRPWWQAGEGVRLSAGRGVPDVAILGGAASPVGIVAGGRLVLVAGTSVGTPIWAGIAAVADQAAGGDLGWLLPSLYRILRSSDYGRDFHPITSGSNGYPAGAGWNPVTGIGTPIVGNLTEDLAETPAPASNLTAYVYASPRFGAVPLTVRVTLGVTGGTGTYPLEGVDFGDGNAGPVPAGATVEHTYDVAGVYSLQGYAIDNEGNATASPPVVVVVGSGGPLTVALNASPATAAVGENVTLTATVSGAPGPYLFNFTLGDAAFLINRTSASVVHRYTAAGTYCAEVVARTEGPDPAGGASARVGVRVGGSAAAACGNPASPLTLVPEPNPEVRDAPADFPSLYTSDGGSSAPNGLAPQVGYASSDPYLAACGCAILRSAGNYSVDVWENDTVNGRATTSVNVTVALPLQATFTASTLAGAAPLTVDFASSVTGGYDAAAADTHWRFGNGYGGIGASAIATYTAPGEYVAVASVTDHGYGNASEAFLIDAEPSATPSALGLTGTVSPAVNVSSGATVSWTASAVGPSSALAGTVVVFDLGNGGGAFGPSARETYFAPEDLPAGNLLEGSVTLDSSRLLPLLVAPVDLPDFFAVEAGGFVPATSALVLAAAPAAAVGLVPLATSATATATGPGGVSVTWRFGDGATATGPIGTHVYYAAGRYTEKVSATDGFADTADRVQTVVADPALALACGPSVRFGNVPYTLHLAPTASGGVGEPYRYAWSLPNGTGSAATNVTVTFDAQGRYAIGLTVHDVANATVSCAWSVVVTDVPSVTFLEVVVGGVGIGIVLAAVFVWATRPPRSKGPDAGA